MTFDEYINAYFANLKKCELTEAMLYAIEGGKHFRPNLIFAICEGYGIDKEEAYDAALALEMVHSYSLLHDDLPCMDNDDLRRGKPTVHKAYGYANAVLAGDGLLTHSFGVIADSNYDLDTKVKMINALSSLAGMNGMLYGQYLDLKNEGLKKDEVLINEINDYKTGALFRCALLFGMYLAKADKDIATFNHLALLIGRVFQLQDDLFEVTKTEEEMGKSLSDARNDKETALDLYGTIALKQKINEHFNEIIELLDKAPFNGTYLKKMIMEMKDR